jgi:uncharacterized protein (DUF1015 family)
VSAVGAQRAGVAAWTPRVLIAGDGEGSGYRRAPTGCTVVYEVATAQHRQLGVVVEVAVRDYGDGTIRRHETVEQKRVTRLGGAGGVVPSFARAPVVLAYRGGHDLRSLLTGVARGDPDIRRSGVGGVRHTVWTDCRTPVVDAVHGELDRLGPLYIADGHHRMAAAERFGHGHVLAVLFPSDEMRVFGYHRYVSRPRGTALPDVLAAIAARPMTVELKESSGPGAVAPEPGVVGVCTGGRWFRLRLRAPSPDTPVRDTLDVVALDDGILAPVFGISDARDHADATPLPTGARDPDRIAGWCADHDALAFLPYPPDVEHVMSVADAGSLLPAKSTWFAPKIDPTLLLHAPD